MSVHGDTADGPSVHGVRVHGAGADGVGANAPTGGPGAGHAVPSAPAIPCPAPTARSGPTGGRTDR